LYLYYFTGYQQAGVKAKSGGLILLAWILTKRASPSRLAGR
jgi:hypothetical protein